MKIHPITQAPISPINSQKQATYKVSLRTQAHIQVTSTERPSLDKVYQMRAYAPTFANPFRLFGSFQDLMRA